MKNIPIKVRRREGNIFHCVTIGGKELKFQTEGETDPRFQILGMLYLEDKPFNMQVPNEVDIK